MKGEVRVRGEEDRTFLYLEPNVKHHQPEEYKCYTEKCYPHPSCAPRSILLLLISPSTNFKSFDFIRFSPFGSFPSSSISSLPLFFSPTRKTEDDSLDPILMLMQSVEVKQRVCLVSSRFFWKLLFSIQELIRIRFMNQWAFDGSTGGIILMSSHPFREMRKNNFPFFPLFFMRVNITGGDWLKWEESTSDLCCLSIWEDFSFFGNPCHPSRLSYIFVSLTHILP